MRFERKTILNMGRMNSPKLGRPLRNCPTGLCLMMIARSARRPGKMAHSFTSLRTHSIALRPSATVRAERQFHSIRFRFHSKIRNSCFSGSRVIVALTIFNWSVVPWKSPLTASWPTQKVNCPSAAAICAVESRPVLKCQHIITCRDTGGGRRARKTGVVPVAEAVGKLSARRNYRNGSINSISAAKIAGWSRTLVFPRMAGVTYGSGSSKSRSFHFNASGTVSSPRDCTWTIRSPSTTTW